VENSFIFNFKQFVIYLFKLTLLVAAVIPFVRYVGDKYSTASTENLINIFNDKRFNEFYDLERNSLDVVFLGSSHSYCTFDPDIFDSELNVNSFQLGSPLQHLDSTYYTLKELLNYQKPKIAIVEVYWDMLDDEFELKQAGMLFQALRNDKYEAEYIEEVFPLSEKVKYNVKLFRYQQDYFAFRNSKLKEKIEAKYNVETKAAQKQQGTEEYRSKGYAYCDYKMLESEFNKTNQFRSLDGKNWNMDNAQKKYLQKIVDTCKQNNIKLIFVTAPVANVSMEFIKNYDLIHNKVQNFADKNNIPYIDYNIVNINEKLLTNDNFRDDAHLNQSGVEIVDNHFINWLINRGYWS